jgi:hypothetical protein
MSDPPSRAVSNAALPSPIVRLRRSQQDVTLFIWQSCERTARKPIGRGVRKICYRSPGTASSGRTRPLKTGLIPDSVLAGSIMKSEDTFGVGIEVVLASQVTVNKRLRRNLAAVRHWRNPCIREPHECVSHDELRRAVSEGEGACSPFFAIRSHLPLRGKLGWMTPRVGVKTTLTTKRTLRGPRSQAGAPFFS